jgi:hypothetical protein
MQQRARIHQHEAELSPCGTGLPYLVNMGRLKRRGSQSLLTQIRRLGTSLTKFLQSCQRNVGTNGGSRSHQ